MFKRKVYDYLKAWKEESDGMSAVMIEGARRVGKSTVVEEFAKKEYDDYCALEIAKQTQADISQQERARRSSIYKTKSKSGIAEKISEWLRKNLYGKFQDIWSESIAKKLDDDIDKAVSATAEILDKHPFGGIEKRLRAAERVARYEKISLASCQRAIADYKEC